MIAAASLTRPHRSALANSVFRSGRMYDLVAFDRLSSDEQVLLSELRDDAAFYGILRPREGSGRTIRAVDRDTALLWYGALESGPLPQYLWDAPEDARDVDRRIAQFVLDGILEIEYGGTFVSGAVALQALPSAEEMPSSSRLQALSLAALHHAESLNFENADELASRLYAFGALPVTPAWERLLPDTRAVLAYVGLDTGSPLERRLRVRFTRVRDEERGGWIAWSNSARRLNGTGEPSHKLYVSPHPADLPHVMQVLVELLPRHDILQFKIGASAHGLLRPDKIVAYFDNEDALVSTASDLAVRLAGFRAQGVPFTAEIGADGLLSWGMDPPRDAQALSWMSRDSWRLWVVRRIASMMISAQHDLEHDAGSVTPARYALERLRLDGVDVDQWSPSNKSWWTS